MRRVSRLDPRPTPRRLVGWLCAIALLAVQVLVASHHATVLAMGVEVCSAEGTKRLPLGDDPLGDSVVTHCDDGCCPSTGAPPAASLARAMRLSPTAFEAVPTAMRLGAEWLAPLSRGPPRMS